MWPDLEAAQAAIDAFRVEYNSRQPHQALGMAFPADRFVSRSQKERLPLHLPAGLGELTIGSAPSLEAVPSDLPSAPVAVAPKPPMTSGFDVDDVSGAVEVTQVVPASGNLALRRQQFWLGPARASTRVTLWADTTVVHVLIGGVRLKTVPSAYPGRPGAAACRGWQARWVTTDLDRPVMPGGPMEVEPLVNACG